MTEQAFRCQNLLNQYQQVYKDFAIKEAQYHQDLDAVHLRMEQEREAEHARNEQLQQFKSSPFIITPQNLQSPFTTLSASNGSTPFNGSTVSVVNCGDCKTHEELEKCLCQQQYGERPHLIANSKQPQLQQLQQMFRPTKQLCEARGHLLNETEQILALRTGENNNSNNDGQVIVVPKEPMLILPTITCSPCKKEFEALHDDFSYKNIVGVNACIHKLSTAIDPKKYTSFRPPPPESEVPTDIANGQNGNTTVTASITQQSVEDLQNAQNAQNATKSKWTNALLIGGGILLFVLCGYLLYSILKNMPYDMVCTRAVVIRQAESQRPSIPVNTNVSAPNIAVSGNTNNNIAHSSDDEQGREDEDDGERIDHSREEYRDERNDSEGSGSEQLVSYQDNYGDSSLEFE